ncbi:hypothetical protein G8759_31120 [Spirosoma aureum]|uniref:Uncharacterized protein n=1 Tax=Spirosoma aureum TaxID=2692134 RepID=A0A6G9AWV1_9BACT|nr:hypothetical protein [Spirosoma aureum]QIP16775.1 hypothetical protein G8759_31120 [Spirosoma aureum]
MLIKITQHRKTPNRAFTKLMEHLQALAASEDDLAAATPLHLRQTAEIAWLEYCMQFRCHQEHLYFSDNARSLYKEVRSLSDKPFLFNPTTYLLWLTWGTLNGGIKMATISLSGFPE